MTQELKKVKALNLPYKRYQLKGGHLHYRGFFPLLKDSNQVYSKIRSFYCTVNLHMDVIEQAQLYQSLNLISRYLFTVLSMVLTHFISEEPTLKFLTHSPSLTIKLLCFYLVLFIKAFQVFNTHLLVFITMPNKLARELGIRPSKLSGMDGKIRTMDRQKKLQVLVSTKELPLSLFFNKRFHAAYFLKIGFIFVEQFTAKLSRK